ncbi:hypothetical protein CYV26_07660 [Carnobacterium maltaromaticum]|uniref:hypothetical protein n=1 Tax=Carnobacterium maltaromaticum TaxID=2751 RepID=UPI000C7628E2|nr:hypothetical protein [Carnobacterium maltaromaticum]PLS35248.1 hypothetical protein CYV30_10665 [Carnobacterium maltaromaticum]PLS35661.1 hypothetical protein CYV31_10645 [Carnobacterium maltaromaticum]PLS36111.1 hypothetical protein CYV33_07655 [Carnobacterium maltaromaticum]PLS42568.1 hypothetical protein CYV28_10600 [Carnobacterium maltaromaticum]PLS45589.1 hypothetical protein CYV27_07650 [Carnobacterium maltaromaticum]
MKNKRTLAIASIILLTIALIVSVIVITPKIASMFKEDSNYRALGTTEAGNLIKIDDTFYVATTSAIVSSLYYDEENGERYNSLVEYVYKLNYDDDYIIIQSITNNFYSLFFKQFEYVIVNKENKEVTILKTKDEFLKECKKRNIKVELKSKYQFDWY